MDENKDDIIDLDDIIRVEIVQKNSDKKRNDYFESISTGKRILYKVPRILLELCGDIKTGSFKIERFPFYEGITKAVKYSISKNRRITPFE